MAKMSGYAVGQQVQHLHYDFTLGQVPALRWYPGTILSVESQAGGFTQIVIDSDGSRFPETIGPRGGNSRVRRS